MTKLPAVSAQPACGGRRAALVRRRYVHDHAAVELQDQDGEAVTVGADDKA